MPGLPSPPAGLEQPRAEGDDYSRQSAARSWGREGSRQKQTPPPVPRKGVCSICCHRLEAVRQMGRFRTERLRPNQPRAVWLVQRAARAARARGRRSCRLPWWSPRRAAGAPTRRESHACQAREPPWRGGGSLLSRRRARGRCQRGCRYRRRWPSARAPCGAGSRCRNTSGRGARGTARTGRRATGSVWRCRAASRATTCWRRHATSEGRR